MMKIILALFVSGFIAASAVHAQVGGISVTLSDSAGRLVYRGQTDVSGTFATPRIPAGNYIVQFKSKNVASNRNDYALSSRRDTSVLWRIRSKRRSSAVRAWRCV